MRNDLIAIITQYKENGQKVEKRTDDVFAEKMSASRSEYYQGVGVGLAPKYVLSIDRDDYDSCIEKIYNEKDGTFTEYKPTHIILDGVKYIVSRDFYKGNSVEVTVR